MEKSTPVRKSHTYTADLLTWREAPAPEEAAPPVSRRPHQVGFWFPIDLASSRLCFFVLFFRLLIRFFFFFSTFYCSMLLAIGGDQQGGVRGPGDGGGGGEPEQEVRSGDLSFWIWILGLRSLL